MHSDIKYSIYNIDSINTFLTKFSKKIPQKKTLSEESAFMDCFGLRSRNDGHYLSLRGA